MGLVAELHLRPRSGIKREERLEEEGRKGGGGTKSGWDIISKDAQPVTAAEARWMLPNAAERC